MSFRNLKKKSFNFITAIFLICLICPIGIAVSQTNNPSIENYPETIRVGIGTASSVIGSKKTDGTYGGFCGKLLTELKDELNRQDKQQIRVVPQNIANQYKGKKYPRYDGIIQNLVEIECGPNSRSSLELKYKDRFFKDEIEVSRNSFYTTSIKLLIKKTEAEKLEQASSINQLEEKLSALKIAVIRGTTTLKQFEGKRNYYPNYVPYPGIQQPKQRLDVRDLVLDDLENDKVKAFASDAIILRTLLDEGVRSEQGYRKGREAYKKMNYVIYPSAPGKYLPNLKTEEYAIAINKNTPYAEWLRETIDLVLENPSLNKAKKRIKEYENGKDISSPPPSSSTGKDPDKDPWDSTVIAALITAGFGALATILVGYWQFGRNK